MKTSDFYLECGRLVAEGECHAYMDVCTGEMGLTREQAFSAHHLYVDAYNDYAGDAENWFEVFILFMCFLAEFVRGTELDKEIVG